MGILGCALNGVVAFGISTLPAAISSIRNPLKRNCGKGVEWFIGSDRDAFSTVFYSRQSERDEVRPE